MANKNNSTQKNDLPDSQADQSKLQPEETIIDMPEVKDIPGQEHVKVPRIREMEDTTISSSDEEGDGILDDLNSDDQQLVTNDADITPEERRLLRQSSVQRTSDESQAVQGMALDERDDDGELLNEKSILQDQYGGDLDTPGADQDDANEDIGEEDEENNVYSQSQRDAD